MHVVRLRGATVDPPGDVVEADLARESVDGRARAALRELGCGQRGGIVLETLDTVVSDAADRAEEAAPGEGVDAVVWDELLARTGQGARLSVTFVVMLTIACLLAAVGVVTNSPVTVVGRDGARARVRPAGRAGGGRGPAGRSQGADGGRSRWASGFAIAVAVTALAAAGAEAIGLIPDDALTNLSGCRVHLPGRPVLAGGGAARRRRRHGRADRGGEHRRPGRGVHLGDDGARGRVRGGRPWSVGDWGRAAELADPAGRQRRRVSCWPGWSCCCSCGRSRQRRGLPESLPAGAPGPVESSG